MRRTTVLCAAVLSLFGCKREAANDAANDAAATAPAPPVNASSFPPEAFAQLRWIEGTWVGTVPNGGSFYETYHFINDSTIEMHGYSDAALTQKGDSTLIEYRGGQIRNAGGWVVTAIDTAGYHFQSTDGSHGPYTWKKTGGGWLATVGNPGNGMTYEMTPHLAKR